MIIHNIIVFQLLNRLPKLQKKIIEDKFIKDLSEEEIAETLNISRQAVNRTKNRALKTLRSILNVESFSLS